MLYQRSTRIIKLLFLFVFLFLLTGNISAQQQYNDYTKANEWADSVYNSLSLEQQIAQLIFVRANYPNKPYISDIDTLISKYNIGGVVFFKGEPVVQATQTNKWNSLAQTPLFVAIDAEWGLSMRLSNTVGYPLQMTLGAIKENSLIYAMGKQIGEQCRRMGIHINFAPVVDVNSNPKNPVIGMRSFGQNPLLVAEKGAMYMKGMQNSGIIASAKHFPGHGNTFVDSHKDLPVIQDGYHKLVENDLLPFQYLVNQGVNSVMIAHLSVPALDNTPNLPSTLSHNIVSDYLIDSMGFEGLVITDGLDMKGVTKYYKEGMVSLKALEAGNDILLIPDNVPLSIANIVDAVTTGSITEERIALSCKKVLKFKYIAGAANAEPIVTTGLINDLNRPVYYNTSKLLTESSITLVKNNNGILPVMGSNTKKALLVVGTEDRLEIEDALLKMGELDIFHVNHDTKNSYRKKLVSKLKEYDIVVVAILNTNIMASKRFGISEEDVDLVSRLSKETKVVLDIFSSPYALNFFDLTKIEAVVVSYHERPAAQRSSAKMIMGEASSFGRLPVDAGGYTSGWGLEYSATKLSYIDPEALGINDVYLRKVDSTAIACIESGVFPGCQILAAKNGAIFYNKSFGYHTYDSVRKVSWNDVYDLASLTKILATTPSIMKMSEEGKIVITGRLSDYLMILRGTDKDSLNFLEVLSHQSGLQNWIPYYESTITDSGWDPKIYQSQLSEGFTTRVAEGMYIRNGYNHIILDSIINSPFQDKSYHYSGLGFYLFRQMIEDINNMSFDDYVYKEFYNPLKIKYLRFNPRKNFSLDKIIPTENDLVFRMQLLHGDVHDQGAAMLGGISGNAGLFGNAYSVAVVMQMFLNGGSYGHTNLFDGKTVDFFNKPHYAADSNRRGLGFDKPLLKYIEHRTNCKDASPSSFGHSGFTGTYAWADPENGLVYVFLSNRVYPDMNNTKLMDLDVRTNIHQLFYEAIRP